MYITCLDVEGVLVPEIWIAFAEASGIPELKKTTRDEPDYDKLMNWRLGILKEHGLGLKEIQDVIAKIDPLPGAKEFLDELRSFSQVILISDTFTQFAAPLMEKLGRPTLFCNTLEVADNGEITGFKMRVEQSKLTTVKALQSIGFDTIASGDSYNDLGMIQASKAGFLFRSTDKIKADGEIVMRTKEVYNNSIPMEYYEKLITGKKKSIKNLYFGQYQFDFPEKKRQDHTNVMTKRRSLKIGKSFYLPIGITMQITERYRPKKKILTKKEAQLKLKKQLERYLMKKAKAGAKIVHCEGNYKKKNNRYEVKASIIKEESVGKIRNIKKLTKKQEEMITPTTAQQ